MSADALYTPYKVVGLVTDAAPFVVAEMGSETFLTLSTGRMFSVFRADRLTPVLVSKPAPGTISLLQARDKNTYAVVDDAIYKYTRTRLVGVVGKHTAPITQLQLLGEFLISCDENNAVKMINVKTHAAVTEMQILRSAPVTSMLHPAALLNKMVFGFADGALELWNIKTGKLIYAFQKHFRHLSAKDARVTALAQSPAADVLAVGFSSGDLLLLNLKLDTVVFKFRQKGAVTAISFRNDAQTSEFPFIVSASALGHLFVWSVFQSENDEDEPTSGAITSKLKHAVYGAHDGAVVKVEFLHGQPVMLTSGRDNSLKSWIFDNADGSPRLLRQRQGFVGFPRQLSFHGDVSASAHTGSYVGTAHSGVVCVDSHGALRFSVVDKHCHFESFSVAALTKNGAKAPSPVLAMDFAFFGARPWGGLVSIHKDSSTAHLWKVEDKAATATALKAPPTVAVPAAAYSSLAAKTVVCSAVAVSPCGHFAAIGYSSTQIAVFNLQSGLFRGLFVAPLEATGAIVGLSIDAASTQLTAATASGHVCFFDFKSRALASSLFLKSSLSRLVGCKESSLCAVSDTRGTIRVIDLVTCKVVRVFLNCHSDEITALVFSLDGRRLLSASTDRTVRVHDLASGKCLSWLLFDAPVASLCLTPNGDLLVGKEGHRGVDVCLDRSLTEHVSFNCEPAKPTPVALAVTAPMEEAPLEENKVEGDVDVFVNKAAAGIQLSTLPKAYWTALCNFELLRRRSAVAQPVVKVATPFFLPNLVDSGRKSSSDSNKDKPADDTVDKKQSSKQSDSDAAVPKSSSVSKRIRAKFTQTALVTNRCQLASLLLNSENSKRTPIEFLFALSPSKVDQEFRLLCLHEQDAHGLRLLNKLFSVLTNPHQLRCNFDVVQSYLHRLLVLHGAKLPMSYSLQKVVIDVRNETQRAVHQLQLLVFTALSLLKSSLNIQLV